MEEICKCRGVVVEICKHRAAGEGTCRHKAEEVEMRKCKACRHLPLHWWQSSKLPRHRQDGAKFWPFCER